MMNNKGQTLIIFVFILPVILGFSCLVIDVAVLFNTKASLDNINEIALEYGVSNISSINIKDKVEKIILENDSDIVIENIEIKQEEIIISLRKKIDSFFGNIFDFDFYNVKSFYKAKIIDDEIIIDEVKRWIYG